MNLNRPLLLIAVLCVLLFGVLALAWQRQEPRPAPPVVVVTPTAASAAASTAAAARAAAVPPNAASAAATAPRPADPARPFDLSLGGAIKLDAQTRGEVEALLNALPVEASKEELGQLRRDLRAHLPPDEADKADLLTLAYRMHVAALLREELGPDAPAVPPAGK